MVCLAFVRSGWVNLGDGQARNLGNNGNYWARTAVSETNGRYLNFNPGNVNPSNSWGRYGGFPLRCVLPVRCRSFLGGFDLTFVSML